MITVTADGVGNEHINVQELLHQTGRTTTMINHAINRIKNSDSENGLCCYVTLVFSTNEEKDFVRDLIQAKINSGELQIQNKKYEIIICNVDEAIELGRIRAVNYTPIFPDMTFVDHKVYETNYADVLEQLHRWDRKLIIQSQEDDLQSSLNTHNFPQEHLNGSKTTKPDD